VTLPGAGTEGLDDVLASRRGSASTGPTYRTLVARAGKLPRRPKAAGSDFFGAGGLKAEKLLAAVRAAAHWATDPAGRVLAYESGVYVESRSVFVHAVAGALGDDYRPAHARAVEEVLVARLHVEGRVVPDSPKGFVNVANGLLDPLTGALHPHTPDHLSVVQLPVSWDPGAVCPTFDGWLDYVAAGRGDDLLEACSLMFDVTSGRQRKPVFLLGPTRFGKSTFIRVLERIVGPAGRSAVGLHELASDRFAAADLFGKILNAAADLSAEHIDDLSRFKSVTGDHPIRAQHKFGRAFVFHNSALFVFSANEAPTVGEVSRAYLARVRPYEFPTSFEGRERPEVETAVLAELPGILVRLVEALRRFHERGDYADSPEARAALDDFARRSDRVRLFQFEATDPDPEAFTELGQLFAHFDRWRQANRRVAMGRHRFYEMVELTGYRAAKREGARGFVWLTRRVEEDWGPPDEPDGAEGAGFPSPRFARGLSEEKEDKERVARG
jgi:putative DNA primase/helicase